MFVFDLCQRSHPRVVGGEGIAHNGSVSVLTQNNPLPAIARVIAIAIATGNTACGA